jgi:erythromycin esterase-like protein
VQITETRPRLFSAVFSSEPVTIKARAVASVTGGAKGCILALSPTASGAATVSGSTQLALNNCDIASNSLASDSFLMSGSATVSTGCVQVAGTAATTSGLALTECAAVKEYAPVVIDPYASVAEPAVTGTCRSKNVGNPQVTTTLTPTAVEADWPDARVYDAYVRGLPRPELPKRAFTRFPTWMWRNDQVAAFLDRLQAINERTGDPEKKCGFYGLDVYSLSASIEAVLLYLDAVDPEAAQVACQRYGCLTPWRAEPVRYGRMALSRGYAVCEKPVTNALIDLLRKRFDYLHRDGEAFFNAEQNARIVAAAEQYYRVMYYGDAVSWNLRDQHMFDTLERLIAHRGPDAKAVVWAHNSHIGNAEFTEMGQVRGEHNIGQLSRARFAEDAALIGFGTDRGTVAAASDWDGPMEIKRVRPARDDSYEGRSRDANIPAFFLETGPGQTERVRADLAEPLLERAIGVIYRPETELLSHYFQAELSRQFDAWIWFTETSAVAAQVTAYAAGPDVTYPFGL